MDRYLVGSPLERPGPGMTFYAQDTHLACPVAVQVLRSELAQNRALSERFTHDARLTALLSSSHVPRVLDVGKLPSGEPFFVSEWVEGDPIDRVLARHGRFSVVSAVDLMIQACEGLAEAHASGLVHGDLRPSNLILCTDRAGRQLLKVLELGASTTLLPESAANAQRYLSPEQTRGSAEIDSRSDVWSLGVVLFELIAGEPPFDGASVAQVRESVLSDPAPSIRALRPDVDPELDVLIRRCLAKDPRGRFRDAEHLRQALMFFGSNAQGARAVGAAEAIEQEAPAEEELYPEGVPKRSYAGFVLGLVVLLALLGVGAWQGRSLFEAVLLDADAEPAEPVVVYEPPFDLPKGNYGALAERELEREPPPAARVPRAPEETLLPEPETPTPYDDYPEPRQEVLPDPYGEDP